MLVQVAAGGSFARLSQISTGFRMTATIFFVTTVIHLTIMFLVIMTV